MSAQHGAVELLDRVQKHDAAAVLLLLRRYEPTVRRIVSRWRATQWVHRVVDADDIVQEAMYVVFRGLTEGRLAIAPDDEWPRFLSRIARRVLGRHVRWHFREKRDLRRTVALPVDWELLSTEPRSDDGDAPSMLDELIPHLSHDDAATVKLRLMGQSWKELAREFRTSASSLRVRITRALRRAAAKRRARNA